MTVQAIPEGERLIDLTAEPSVPPNQRFIFEGLIWPAPGAIEENKVTSAKGNLELLLDDTLAWIGRVLKPEWVAPDARTRLVAASAIVSGQDAFVGRYAIDRHRIQIVVTRFHAHFVIAPPGGAPASMATRIMHEYLQVDRPQDKFPWTGGPWEMLQIATFTFGYQTRSAVIDWRDSVNYLTNGQAIKFSIKKVGTQPPGSGAPKTGFAPSPEAERHWFDQKQ